MEFKSTKKIYNNKDVMGVIFLVKKKRGLLFFIWGGLRQFQLVVSRILYGDWEWAWKVQKLCTEYVLAISTKNVTIWLPLLND